MARAKNQNESGNDGERLESEDGLVVMEKNGEQIPVHPECVDAHKKLGWAEA